MSKRVRGKEKDYMEELDEEEREAGGLVFEDPYEEPYPDSESEGEEGGGEEGGEGAGMNFDDNTAMEAGGAGAMDFTFSKMGEMIPEEDEEDGDGEDAAPATVWRPGIDSLGEGEKLECDLSAYVMYHAMSVDWPCLSFDIVPDDKLGVRSKFPLSATVVAGTQADTSANNRLLVMRFGSMHKTQNDDKEDTSDEEESDDEDLDDDATVEVQRINHNGGVNRVRCMPQEPHIVATWSETGKVHLFDIRPQLKLLDAAEGRGAAPPVARGYGPVYTFSGHKTEGFAMDWSPVSAGQLVTGSCDSKILVWDVNAGAAAEAMAGGSSDMGGVWNVRTDNPFTSHTDSVEDLQWSPNESTVFASASVDRTVRIWDTRAKGKSMLHVNAHDSDVNVISWSHLVSYLMVSGSDDGSFKIWDLRSFKSESPVALFRWHKKPITSVQWAFDDENVLAVASEDNQVTLWDMSLEMDEEAEMAMLGKAAAVPSTRDPKLADIPPQLLFIHAGQEEVKEARFHPQLPGVVISTALDGFNVFKPDVQVTT